MIDLKPYGAFLEYSVRPLIEELKDLINLCDKKKIKPDFKLLCDLHFATILLDTFKTIFIAFMVCGTAYIICKT